MNVGPNMFSSSEFRCLGITRVRNEQLILSETLDHFAQYCPQGILVLDDTSTDDSRAIPRRHPAVLEVLDNPKWRPERFTEEWRLRQVLLDRGRDFEPDWFLYFDADERLEVATRAVPPEADSLAFRLYDAYITPEDAELIGTARRWFGPEYRDIVMFFRNLPHMSYHLADQRVVAGATRTELSGYAKHFGKALSIEHWEETCAYYSEHFPEPYRSKWHDRKGGAVHRLSDFGRPLQRWQDVKAGGSMIHDASSAPALDEQSLDAMRRARATWYLCPSCSSSLRLVRGETVTMTCPNGCVSF